MTVNELIEALKDMPQEARVWHLWDGSLRTEIEHVWVTRDGQVGTSGTGEVCYHDDDRPVHAPTEKEEPYWKVKREYKKKNKV